MGHTGLQAAWNQVRRRDANVVFSLGVGGPPTHERSSIAWNFGVRRYPPTGLRLTERPNKLVRYFDAVIVFDHQLHPLTDVTAITRVLHDTADDGPVLFDRHGSQFGLHRERDRLL